MGQRRLQLSATAHKRSQAIPNWPSRPVEHETRWSRGASPQPRNSPQTRAPAIRREESVAALRDWPASGHQSGKCLMCLNSRRPRASRSWSRRQESNLYLALRRHSFYPLNYGERVGQRRPILAETCVTKAARGPGRRTGSCCPGCYDAPLHFGACAQTHLRIRPRHPRYRPAPSVGIPIR